MSIASEEKRKLAIEAYRSGKGTQRQIAELFGVSFRTFCRWWRAYRDEGRTAPLPRGHNPPALDEETIRRLDELIEAHPDWTLEKLRDELGVDCTIVTIHNWAQRLGWRYKKNRYVRVNS